MQRRRLPIETRRAQVLDAALRLVSTRGHSALSVEAVAREAGVSKTVVYDAYGGLAPLLSALLDREERSALRSLDAAMATLDPAADPTDAALGWALSLARAVQGNPASWRVMLLAPEALPEVVRERVERGRSVVVQQARVLAAAIAAEGGAAAADPELFARAMVAAAEEGAKLLLDDPAEFPPERLAAFASALIGATRAAEVAS